MKIFCMCLHDHHYKNLKKLNYEPVGLGQAKFNEGWLNDKSGENISGKNKFYGEYSFYYWIWKNYLPSYNENFWLGFSGYRYHWAQEKNISSDTLNQTINANNFAEFILKKPKEEWNSYDVILGEKIFVNNWKLSKIVKKGFKKLLKNPLAFSKKNQNIKLHFDIFHGEGVFDKAIDLLDKENREGFKDFVETEKSFNRENLFICKSKKLMNSYFDSIFRWLFNCEKVFGLNLHGYEKTRLYAFLAERYISYWFQKNSKVLEWPLFFFDTNKNRVKL